MPGLVGDAPLAPLTDGVGSVLDREVYFPPTGYAGPGFHNWPGSADVLVGEYETASSHPVPCQKDVQRNVRRRDRGQRPTATEDPDTKQRRRRQSRHCSRVRWPRSPHLALGHIPQDTDTKPLLRIRPHAKQTFGETFGAATGVSDPRLQKTPIRNNGAGGKAATVAGYAGPGCQP